MHEVTLERHADVPLTFTGELIADVSSEDDGNDRWEEIRVWRTTSDRTPWVIQRVGKSRHPEEVDLVHVFRATDVLNVRQRLKRQDTRDKQRWFLTDLALDALEEAAENDPRLQSLLVETIT